MKQVTREMLKIYKPYSGLDWMNYKLVKRDATAHHIVKKCDGGKLVRENVAILMPTAHEYLHLIECKELRLYLEINKCFKVINESGREPSEYIRRLMEEILCEFEDLHKWDKNSKGKILVQKKYLKRW